MLTTTYKTQEWALVSLRRESCPLMGKGWEASFAVLAEDSEDLDDSTEYLTAHKLDGSDLWAIHFLMRGDAVVFSHGFGSLGITLVPVLPAELVELIALAFATGHEDGDEVSSLGWARCAPVLLEMHGQLRLEV